jgi:hypothetical protein
MLAAPSAAKGSAGFAGGDMMAMNVPSGGSAGASAPLPTQVAPEQPPAPAPAPPMQEVSSLGSDSSAPADSSGNGGSDHASGGLQPAMPIASEPAEGSNTTLATAPAPEPGPAMLKTIRLSSNDPPLTVIFDLTGPVRYEKSMESTANGAVVTLVLRDVKPGDGIAKHVVFDRSIFKDCDISRDSDKTTITLNMQPITSYSVVPLDDPARLLVTFTPQNPPDLQKTSANN